MSKNGPLSSLSLSEASVCPACGASLRCGMVSGDSTCWCYDMPRVMAVPPLHDGSNNAPQPACLCQNCLNQLIANHDLQPAAD